MAARPVLRRALPFLVAGALAAALLPSTGLAGGANGS